MKIVFMAYDRPNYTGGPIINARRLLPELRKRGHEVHAFIFYHQHAPSAKYLEAQGIQCHTLPWLPYIEDQIKWILKKVLLIQPDVFVPNIFVSGYFASRWIRQAGIPTIAAYRSDDVFYRGMIEEFVLGNPEWAVSGLVCVSEYLKEHVESLKPQNTKLCFIPSGVPIPEKSSNQTGALKIAYVGRLVQQQKRIRDLIDSIANVIKQLPDITAMIIGDGNERPYLEKKVEEYHLSQQIQFAGAVSSELLHSHLINYHVILLLSDYEGTPGALMDGMACGLVPVCLDIAGGVRELVKHEKTGLLVNDRHQSFEVAIKRLYYDQQLRYILSRQARAHISNNYSLNIIATRWENFCENLLQDVSKNNYFNIPSKFDLPPVRAGLDREDKRTPNLFIYLLTKVKELVYRLNNKLNQSKNV